MTMPTSAPSSSPAIAPIRRELELACTPADAFRMFTEEIGQWWPLSTHSVFTERSRGCGMDREPGGLIYELDPEGARHAWGTIQIWEPPGRVAFTFHPGREAETAGTVEVRFSPSGSGTKVTLEHSGWELLGDLGAAMRSGYEHGWGEVFGRLYYEHATKGGAAPV